MRTFLSVLSVLMLGEAVAGCNAVVSDINSVTAALSSPQASQAAKNIRSVSTAVACNVAVATADYQQLLAQISAGKAAIKDAQVAYTISSVICVDLGGAVIGPASAN